MRVSVLARGTPYHVNMAPCAVHCLSRDGWHRALDAPACAPDEKDLNGLSAEDEQCGDEQEEVVDIEQQLFQEWKDILDALATCASSATFDDDVIEVTEQGVVGPA